MIRHRRYTRAAEVLMLASAAILMSAYLSGCAARSHGKAALTIGEAVLAIDKAETTAYQAKLYPEAKHLDLSRGILRMLEASRGYERAVVAGTDPTVARTTLAAALRDMAAAAKGIGPLETAITAASGLLGGT